MLYQIAFGGPFVIIILRKRVFFRHQPQKTILIALYALKWAKLKVFRQILKLSLVAHPLLLS